MTVDFDSADASFYYSDTASAERARFDSSAIPRSLADAVKNAVFLFSRPLILLLS
ncbi:MAG: hypothetical protein OXI11_10985 [Gammaproteobacteria bacterium]|nr:hypothetical protein [Gammaproteobacteria bacterium]